MKKLLHLSAALSACTLLGCGVAQANSPYISKVYDFRPAPGQFVNELPEYEPGDTHATMLLKATEQIAGDRAPGMISLGAYGGYVVFGFDHPVVNKAGERDFKIYGNALISDRDNRGGSSEPGIVMVSADTNGNGLPDDPWYELAGSEYTKETTVKNYRLTYYAPDPSHAADPDPDDRYVTDRTYIRWTSNDAGQPEGYVARNTYHPQSYWPQWIADKTMEFEGTKLADNYVDISGDGSYFVLVFHDWGYADNLPNNEDKGFDIDWAVDADGKPAKLDKIDFVKVYTGVNQCCGRLGETSTEVSGAEDLHPDISGSVQTVGADRELLLLTASDNNGISVRTSAEALEYRVISASGASVGAGCLYTGENRIDTSALAPGIYLLHTSAGSLKFIR